MAARCFLFPHLRAVLSVGFILLLAGYWVTAAWVVPSRLAEVVTDRLRIATGLTPCFSRAFRLSSDTVELRSLVLTDSRGNEVLRAPALLLSAEPGFEPPYRFSWSHGEVRADLQSLARSQDEEASAWSETSLRFHQTRLWLMHPPGLPGVGLSLEGLDGELVLSADRTWKGQGTFGPKGEGRFEVKGTDRGIDVAEFDLRTWTDVHDIGAMVVQDKPLPFLLARSGFARITLAYTPADHKEPLRIQCSFRDLAPGPWERVTATGDFSLALGTGGVEGPSTRGHFFFEKLDVRGFLFERLSGILNGLGPSLRFENLRGRLFDGPLRGSGRASLSGPGTAEVSFGLKNGNAQALPYDWLGSPCPFSGQVNLTLQIEGEDILSQEPTRYFGSGQVELIEAGLAPIPLVGGLNQFVLLSQQFAFDSLQADFSLTQDGILLRKGIAKSRFFNIVLARPGAIRFSREIDLELLVRRAHREERRFPVFTRLSTAMKDMFLQPLKGMLTLRLHVYGSLSQPLYKLLPPPRDE
jgi:hypothetical protein